MISLSKYRLNSLQEIHELLDVPGFFEFAISAYNFLEIMEEGTVFKFASKCPDEKKLEWFIKVACLFIQCNHFEYEFNDNWTSLRRKRLTDLDKQWKQDYLERLQNS